MRVGGAAGLKSAESAGGSTGADYTLDGHSLSGSTGDSGSIRDGAILHGSSSSSSPADAALTDSALSAALLHAGISPASLTLPDACRLLARSRPAFLAALRDDSGAKPPLAARQAVANALSCARRRGCLLPGIPPVRLAGSLPQLVFATYGDERYAQQRERIAALAESSGWFGPVVSDEEALQPTLSLSPLPWSPPPSPPPPPPPPPIAVGATIAPTLHASPPPPPPPSRCSA